MPDLVLPDLADFLDEKHLVLPIRKKRYVVKEATGETFLRLQRLGAALAAAESPSDPAAAEFNAVSEVDMSELCLGKTVHAQMIKDDLTGSEIERATSAAFFWHIGQGAAVVEAAFVGVGKARKAPRKAAPRKSPKTARTTHTGAASTTRSRASGTGTTTPRNSSRKTT